MFKSSGRMSIMDNLKRAKEIHTEGLMSGGWTRLQKEKPSPLIFQSKTHPKFILQFTKVWMVQYWKEDNELYSYFWEPTDGYLTDRGPCLDEKKLSVRLLGVEGKEVDLDKIILNLRRENDKWRKDMESYREKIDDLSQQVHSLQLICNNQERCLRNLKRDRADEKKPEEEKDRTNPAADKPPFLPPYDKQPFPFLRPPPEQSVLHQPDPKVDNSDRCVNPLLRPHGPQFPEAYDVYGPSPYKVPVPFRGYDPYCYRDMPPPAYDHTICSIPYGYPYDYPYGNCMGHPDQYSSMPVPQIPETPVMWQLPRREMGVPMANHSARSRFRPAFREPAANTFRKQSYEDESKQNIKRYRDINHGVKEQSPRRNHKGIREKIHKAVAPQSY